MQKQAKEIQYFFYSQAFADGFRITFAILLPALIGLYFNQFDIGLTISLGAMCVSLTDAPGPVIHKRNGMLFCAGFAFIVALITGYARLNIYTMGIGIVVASFFFSMFTVFGNRATAVGNAAILIMILTMDQLIEPDKVFFHSVLILFGGLFYTTVSLLVSQIRPYRPAQRALGECIREIASYLSIKANFYSSETDLDSDYRRLVAQQIIVNEKQELVRELLYKTSQIVKETTVPGRKLLFSFIETIDLFEDITASYYDYALLRKQFGHTGALDLINSSLKKMASELDAIGIAIQTNTSFAKTFDYDAQLRELKTQIDSVTQKDALNGLVLRKILVNLRKILGRFNNILQYFQPESKNRKSSLDHTQFVTHQSLDPKLLWDNLTYRSSVFRHAFRVSLACISGFIIAKIIGYGHHSYWILMTISFILKPAFSLTRQRNIERLTGTLIGGAIGVLVMVFIPNKTTLFIFMVLFMLGTYSFMRIRYQVMVVCATAYVLILFYFLGAGFKDLALERVLDTVIGCSIAFLVSYFLFPDWESEQLENHIQGILKSNAAYLKKILEALSGHKVSMLEYKLARKNVYLHSANLSAAFQRMLTEPKSKQKAEKEIHQFVVLNNILFSNIASITTNLLSTEPRVYPKELINIAKKAYLTLIDSLKKFGNDNETELTPSPVHAKETTLSADDLLMKEQLNFICKLSVDIDKTTSIIIG